MIPIIIQTYGYIPPYYMRPTLSALLDETYIKIHILRPINTNIYTIYLMAYTQKPLPNGDYIKIITFWTYTNTPTFWTLLYEIYFKGSTLKALLYTLTLNLLYEAYFKIPT